jgi:hypothetical protein
MSQATTQESGWTKAAWSWALGSGLAWCGLVLLSLSHAHAGQLTNCAVFRYCSDTPETGVYSKGSQAAPSFFVFCLVPDLITCYQRSQQLRDSLWVGASSLSLAVIT